MMVQVAVLAFEKDWDMMITAIDGVKGKGFCENSWMEDLYKKGISREERERRLKIKKFWR